MKSLCTIVLIALVGFTLIGADDIFVKAPMERAESSKKTGGSGMGSETGAAAGYKTPTNLRDDPYEIIPFEDLVPRAFVSLPMGSRVKIGPMPDALKPMGPPKPIVKVESIAKGPVVDIPVRDVVEIPKANDEVESAGQSVMTTTAPFLQWIRETKNAQDIAKSQRETYESNELQDKMKRDAAAADIFLNIRFPYTGNQDIPPSGGAVIYSLPQR
jgi:hypothetical protein